MPVDKDDASRPDNMFVRDFLERYQCICTDLGELAELLSPIYYHRRDSAVAFAIAVMS